ncbi:MAG: toprim domain-containing protein, partial [Oscillospiraceae bacterium]|nr:toprim domain-containing protein [Oscillospiraceae bacterium]
NLFALNLAKKQTERRYILAEGYMDVIAMHQAGFSSAIATLGTALTEEQAAIIAKYADEVVLSYDSDEAGQKATRRAIDIFNRVQMKVSVLTIPGAKDPDEFIKKFGGERFQMLLDGSNNAIEYGMLKAKAKYDIGTNDGRLGYIKDAIAILSGRITATERDVYAGRLAEETGIAKNAILNQLESSIRARQSRVKKERENALLHEGVQSRVSIPNAGSGGKALGVVFSEQQLVAAMLKNADFYPLIHDKIKPEQFISPDMQHVYETICRKTEMGEAVDFSGVSMDLPSETIALLSRIIAQNYDVGFTWRDIEMHIQRIQQSVSVSAQAAELSADDIARRLKELSDKKR